MKFSGRMANCQLRGRHGRRPGHALRAPPNPASSELPRLRLAHRGCWPSGSSSPSASAENWIVLPPPSRFDGLAERPEFIGEHSVVFHEHAILGEVEAARRQPGQRRHGGAHVAVVDAIDGAAGRVAEQVRPIDELRADTVDGVDVQRDDVALAAERHRDKARVRSTTRRGRHPARCRGCCRR